MHVLLQYAYACFVMHVLLLLLRYAYACFVAIRLCMFVVIDD